MGRGPPRSTLFPYTPLFRSEGEGGTERVEVVHEALLSAWPRLVTWRREDAEGARLRDQLRAAARKWHDRGRPRRSEEHTSELQSQSNLVCRLLLGKKNPQPY